MKSLRFFLAVLVISHCSFVIGLCDVIEIKTATSGTTAFKSTRLTLSTGVLLLSTTNASIHSTGSTGLSILSGTSPAQVRDLIGAGTSSFDGAFSSLSGKPTTLSGYGITDGFLLTGTLPVAQVSGLGAAATAATGSAGLAVLGSESQADARSAIGAGTSSFDGAFSSLLGKPTTLSGYGITDGITASGTVARANTSGTADALSSGAAIPSAVFSGTHTGQLTLSGTDVFTIKSTDISSGFYSGAGIDFHLTGPETSGSAYMRYQSGGVGVDNPQDAHRIWALDMEDPAGANKRVTFQLEGWYPGNAIATVSGASSTTGTTSTIPVTFVGDANLARVGEGLQLFQTGTDSNNKKYFVVTGTASNQITVTPALTGTITSGTFHWTQAEFMWSVAGQRPIFGSSNIGNSGNSGSWGLRMPTIVAVPDGFIMGASQAAFDVRQYGDMDVRFWNLSSNSDRSSIVFTGDNSNTWQVLTDRNSSNGNNFTIFGGSDRLAIDGTTGNVIIGAAFSSANSVDKLQVIGSGSFSGGLATTGTIQLSGTMTGTTLDSGTRTFSNSVTFTGGATSLLNSGTWSATGTNNFVTKATVENRVKQAHSWWGCDLRVYSTGALPTAAGVATMPSAQASDSANTRLLAPLPNAYWAGKTVVMEMIWAVAGTSGGAVRTRFGCSVRNTTLDGSSANGYSVGSSDANALDESANTTAPTVANQITRTVSSSFTIPSNATAISLFYGFERTNGGDTNTDTAYLVEARVVEQ